MATIERKETYVLGVFATLEFVLAAIALFIVYKQLKRR